MMYNTIYDVYNDIWCIYLYDVFGGMRYTSCIIRRYDVYHCMMYTIFKPLNKWRKKQVEIRALNFCSSSLRWFWNQNIESHYVTFKCIESSKRERLELRLSNYPLVFSKCLTGTFNILNFNISKTPLERHF